MNEGDPSPLRTLRNRLAAELDPFSTLYARNYLDGYLDDVEEIIMEKRTGKGREETLKECGKRYVRLIPSGFSEAEREAVRVCVRDVDSYYRARNKVSGIQ